MGKVVVVGSMNMDILSTMARAPKAGETVIGDTVIFCPGGKGLNQAVAAAGAGADVHFVGRLGQDRMGDEVEAFLKDKGIDTTGIARSATKATANALILVDQTSENWIVVVPAANAETSPEDAAKVAIAKGDIVVSQFEVPRTTVAATFARARAVGALTVLNAAPALDDAPDQMWADTDILIVNETELSHFARTEVAATAPAAEIAKVARSLSRRKGQVVVATLGVRGAVVVTDDGVSEVPGRKVKAVDTTGAGDCFVGTLAAQLSKGQDLSEAVRVANVSASISVTRVGTGTAMPVWSEIEAALKG
jgi:ribokinase